MSKRRPHELGQDIELMMHADGELDAASEVALAARLDRDPQALAKLEALTATSEVVRAHLELSADELLDRRLAGMWRDVAKGIDDEAAAQHGHGQGIWGAITGWLDRHRGHVLTGVVSAGAVAAIALILRPGDRHGADSQRYAPIDVQPAALRSPPSIESLDTPGGTGTVLNLEDEDGNTAVIWVTPEDIVEGI